MWLPVHIMRLSSAIPHFWGNSWNFAPVSKNICIRLVSWIAPITMSAHSAVCINLLSFLPQFSTLTLSIRFCAFCGLSTSRQNCEMRCLKTSRRLSQFVGEEIYNAVPFLFINYRIYMALDETTKTILIYVWRKYRNNLRSGLPKKMGKSKDRLISGGLLHSRF